MASFLLQSLRKRTLQCGGEIRNSLLQNRTNGTWKTFQRKYSNRAGAPGFGIAFDIDGVLLRGGRPIPGSSRALQRLYGGSSDATHLRVPYVFLTNGGGVTEATKAVELSRELGVSVFPDQVLLGHTPFRKFVSKFGDKCVLAVGKHEPDVVMKSYGFKHVIHIDSYVSKFDNIDPLASYKPWLQSPPTNVDVNIGEVAAVFVVSDPVDWGRDLQVLCDVLRSGGHPLRGTQEGIQTPIYFASDDLEYQSTFPVPRFGMGAFRIILESIYNKLPVDPFIYTTFGKPQPSVYKNAEQVLQQIQERMLHAHSQFSRQLKHGLSFPPPVCIDPPALAPLKTIYMIGDNLETDIKGANLAGDPWFSILTRTGVFQGGKSAKKEITAFKIVEDVEEAIDFIFDREGLEKA